MYYVYILQSKKDADKIYIGYSNNLKRRVKEHNAGESDYTNNLKPWRLIYYEAFTNKRDAQKRESRLKKFDNTWKNLQRRIKNCFREN